MIEGLLRIKYNHLPDVAAMLPDLAMKTLTIYATESLLPQARENQAPHIDTGELNRSGTFEPLSAASGRVVFTGGAMNRSGERRIYAEYHELGTRFTGAYPFLLPAADQTFPHEAFNAGIQVFGSL